jgi:adenylate cyclase, class 2
MATEEIEVKFLRVDHADIRQRLDSVGAKLVHPMQLLKRAIIDYPDRRLQSPDPTNREQGGFIRVRTEPDGTIELTYKYFHGDKDNRVSETAVKVSDFEATVKIFQDIGLIMGSYQESRREVWHLLGAEIVLDEWPWAEPFIEIEADNRQIIDSVCRELGLDITKAAEGSANNVYRDAYPNMKSHHNIGDVPIVKFGLPIPKYLTDLN